MSRVCGLFLFGVGIGLVIALIFPKTFFMVIMAALCLLAGYNLFCSCQKKTDPVPGDKVCFVVNPFSYALSTLPLLKQEVQTYIFFEFPPSAFTLTDLMLDFHILFDLL